MLLKISLVQIKFFRVIVVSGESEYLLKKHRKNSDWQSIKWLQQINISLAMLAAQFPFERWS